MVQGLLPGCLVVAALCLAGTDPVAGDAASFRPGVVILLAGALASSVWRGRLGACLSLAAILVVVMAAGRQSVVFLGADRGLGSVVVGALGLAALAIAAASAVHRLSVPSRSGRRSERRVSGAAPGDWSRPAQVVGLVVLCAIGAELLAAYSDSTGDLPAIAFSVVFFAALYGAPALLVRDVARRRGWGWPSMLLLFTALGVAQACLIDQSLFSSDYQGYEGWEESRRATLVPALGVSAFNAYNFVVGHVIFSFGAPVAIAEGWRPERAQQRWLGPVGTLMAVLAYALAAALIVSDPESRSGSTLQLSASAGVVVALIAGAVLSGVRSARRGPPTTTLTRSRCVVPVWATLAAAFVAALVAAMAPETWVGFSVGVAATSAVCVAVLVAGRVPSWSTRHIAAVGVAFLLARGLLAFTYFPLIGEVAAGPKYLHNAAMVVVVVVAGWLALQPGQESPATRRRGGPAGDPEATGLSTSVGRTGSEERGGHPPAARGHRQR